MVIIFSGACYLLVWMDVFGSDTGFHGHVTQFYRLQSAVIVSVGYNRPYNSRTLCHFHMFSIEVRQADSL